MKPLDRDLYQVLGVDKDADEDKLKKAFREKAREHHPDVGGDEEEFKWVSLAYNILGDGDKRKTYDATGCAIDEATVVRKKAEGHIVNTLTHFIMQNQLDKLVYVDVMDKMQEVLKSAKKNFRSKKKDNQSRIEQLNGLKSRFRHRGSGLNLAHVVLDNQIEMTCRQIGQIDVEIKSLDTAIKIIKDEYEFEQMFVEVVMNSYSGFSTSSTTSTWG